MSYPSRLLLILLPVLLLAGTARAVDVSASDVGPLEIGAHATFLEDPSGELTLEEVITAHATGQFKPRPPSGESVSFGYTGSAWWLRLELENPGQHATRRVLELAHSGLSYVDFYQRDASGPLRTNSTGRLRPFETRDVPNRMFAFQLEMPPTARQEVYLRIATTGPMHLPARLWHETDYNRHVVADYALQAAYFGVLAAMLLFNLGLFLAIRDRLYLLYLGVLVGSALTIGAQNGLTDQFLPFISPLWAAISTNVGYSLGLGMLLLFMRQMLESPHFLPRLDRGLRIWAMLLFASPLLFAISLPLFIQPAALAYLLTSLLMLGVSLHGALQRHRRAYFFVVAYSVFLLAILVSVLRARGWLPTNTLTVHTLQIGSVMEMLLLAFALGDRFIELRAHRERADVQAKLAEERRIVAERLSDTERRYRTLIQSSLEGIAVHRNGIVIYANQTALRIGGATRADQVIGRRLLDFVAPEYRELVTQRVTDAMTHDGPTPLVQMEFLRLDGGRMDVESQSTRIMFDGAPAIQVAIHDVTRQRQVERELVAARQAAEEASQAKSRFLAAASHDLRQPIQAARLFVASLQQSELSADSQQLVERLNLSVRTLSDLLEALLDISKLDAGTIQLKPELIALDDIMDTLDQEFVPVAEARGLRCKLWFPPRPLFVCADRNLVLRLLRNLIDNALKYTERGGILIAARPRSGGILFQIYDTGIGIAEQNLASIFDEYFQVDNFERDHAKGLGLGLSIVSRLARMLQTQVRCVSRLTLGSRFEFALTLAEPASVVPVDTMSDANGEGLLSGCRIAIIEDNALVGEALQLAFESLGARVKCWRNAAEALADPALMTFNCYVSDLRLPGASGIELLHEIEARAGKRISAVLITGDTSPDRIALTANAPWPVLFKPVGLPALVEALRPQSGAPR